MRGEGDLHGGQEQGPVSRQSGVIIYFNIFNHFVCRFSSFVKYLIDKFKIANYLNSICLDTFISIFFSTDLGDIMNLEKALIAQYRRGQQSILRQGRAVGVTAGIERAQVLCSAAQNRKIQSLRDHLVNYRSLVRRQERLINSLQGLLKEAEDALRILCLEQAEIAIPPLLASLAILRSLPVPSRMNLSLTFLEERAARRPGTPRPDGPSNSAKLLSNPFSELNHSIFSHS